MTGLEKGHPLNFLDIVLIHLLLVHTPIKHLLLQLLLLLRLHLRLSNELFHGFFSALAGDRCNLGLVLLGTLNFLRVQHLIDHAGLVLPLRKRLIIPNFIATHRIALNRLLVARRLKDLFLDSEIIRVLYVLVLEFVVYWPDLPVLAQAHVLSKRVLLHFLQNN